MSISILQLIQSGVPPTQARMFAEPLTAACERFDIDTPNRISAFVAQCLVESQFFTKLEEDLWYRKPERINEVFRGRVGGLQQASQLAGNPKDLANVVYANRNGNGDSLSGDGWKYRGRGLIQLTGRGNYQEAALGLGRPYISNPDLVALPEDACLTAGWYWHRVSANRLADAGAIDAITKAVNGPAMHQATLRRQYSEEARVAFA